MDCRGILWERLGDYIGMVLGCVKEVQLSVCNMEIP